MLVLQFKNINSVGEKHPICRINLNGQDIFSGKVQQNIKLQTDFAEKNSLKIFFENKTGKDTVLDGKTKQVVQDLNFELDRIFINGLDLAHLIWESKYVYQDTEIESCLFFGPKGHWEINFDTPILKWFLKTNHEKNGNDPTWETDYNYYEEACQRLSKIQTK